MELIACQQIVSWLRMTVSVDYLKKNIVETAILHALHSRL